MLTVQQLSQEIGIGADTLRIWERRYGFPEPHRDRRGHRRYPAEQVDELRIVQKLKMLGQRPQSIFSLSATERLHLLETLQQTNGGHLESLTSLVYTGSPLQIDQYLNECSGKGCVDFIFSALLPFLEVLEKGWVTEKLSISREHMISDLVVDHLKIFLIVPRSANTQQPHCVFATINGERHKLGLLMAACLFSNQGIRCTILYDDLPLTEIPRVCAELGSDAVALSFSSNYSRHKVLEDLSALRRLLPQPTDIIVGGKAVGDLCVLSGIVLCPDLKQVGTVAARLVVKKGGRA